jgi:putative colanic acid biosynthesis acetyltransferase WcaF
MQIPVLQRNCLLKAQIKFYYNVSAKKFKLPKFREKNAFTVQLWWFVYYFLFKPSPNNVQLETILLRIFGEKIGKKVILRPSCQITYP